MTNDNTAQAIGTVPFAGRVNARPVQSRLNRRCRMKTHYVFVSALFFALATSAHATTFTQFAHNVKEDAVHAGKKVVGVGAETGHAVVHAGKVVGSDVASGVEHGYHATVHAVKKVE